MYGARRLTCRVVPLSLSTIISPSSSLGRLGVLRRRWPLPILVRITLPLPVRRNRLAVALWVLSLVFPSFFFRGISSAPCILSWHDGAGWVLRCCPSLRSGQALRINPARRLSFPREAGLRR